jgi:hypothetical protein
MATSLKEWDTTILPSIPNLPYTALYTAVRNACRRFCEITRLWVYTLPYVDIVALTADYELHIPDGSSGDGGIDLNAELIGIPENGVRYRENGEATNRFNFLDLTSETDMDEVSSIWKYETDTVPSKYWMDNVDKKLHVYPIPTVLSTDGLEVHVELEPDKTCTTVPDFLYRDYREEIKLGALAELFGATSMPWYDKGLADENEARFKNACSNLKSKKFTGPTNKEITLKLGFFA